VSEQDAFAWSGHYDRPRGSGSERFSVGVYPVDARGKRSGAAWLRVAGLRAEPWRSRVHIVADAMANRLADGKRALFCTWTFSSYGVSIRVTAAGREAGVEVVR